MTYEEFISTKIEVAPETGFEIEESEIHPSLLPHQKVAVQWAIKGGRRALFESFGLGKTIQELEYCRIVTKHIGGQALIVLPLGVRQEFKHDAVHLLDMDEPAYVRTMAEAKENDTKILMTNYERVRDGDIDPTYFTVCCLDEAAVLRSFGSKTYQTFLDKFKGVPFKMVATATPSPNRYKELIHYAGFLEIMDTGQALTRFFQRDSTKANNLTLYPNREKDFWMWMASWALFCTKPSDFGFDDTGYDLPELDIRVHVLDDDMHNLSNDRDGQIRFLRDTGVSLSDAAAEKRSTIEMRVSKAKQIIEESPGDSFILWHDLEAERHEIKRQIPEVVDIYGSMDYDLREKRTIDFSEGRVKYFATKKSLSGSGCNFQKYCHRAIFVGIDYEFNDFIQAVHRIYRFLQTEQVIIDIIYTQAEADIYEALMEKWKRHNYLAEQMRNIIKENGLDVAYLTATTRKRGIDRVQVKGNKFTAVLNDCVDECGKVESDSVDLIHTSIPFGNHYEYSANYNDFGHNENTARFFEQMDFLTPNLLRILKPGRIAAIHVKDRVLFGNATGTGMPTIEPFHAICIEHYMKHGFQYIGMITIVTDVVRENNQTYRLGWTEQCKDGSKMGVGCPEYVLLFRKLPTDTSKAYADDPVTKEKTEYTRAQWQIDAHAFWRSSGDRLLSKDEIMNLPMDQLQKTYTKYSRGNVYNYKEHIALANELDEHGKLPAVFMCVAPGSWTDDVWDDINRMKTLNTSQSRRKQTMHVCPLQIDTVERIINRYSNPGELVFDPFGGIMTVPYVAIKMGRKGYGVELNPDYFRDGVGYLREAEAASEVPTLFDLINDAM